MSEILLIDAEQPFAQQLVESLQGSGFTVAQLEDGKEGLEYARANQPALIVLCVELPKMSGYSICNKLKKDGDLKSIPLIITSSEATPETFAQHKKLKTRAEDYLIKPFEPADLLEKIKGLIEIPGGGAAVPPPPPDDELASFDGLEEFRSDDLGSDDLNVAELSGSDILGDALSGSGDVELNESDLHDFGGNDVNNLSDDDLLDSLGGDDDMLGFDGNLDDDADLASLGEDASAGGDGDSLGDSLSADALGDLDDNDGLGNLDDSLGLDDLDGGSNDGDLDLGGAVAADQALDDFDDAFETMAPLAEAEASDSASPAAIQPVASSNTAGADFAQISALRRENSELQARVSELEMRLKGAEDAVEASKNQLSQSKTSSSSTARDVLNLKEQLMAKDKELLAMRDEMFEKEKAGVEIQEEIENVRSELSTKASQLADKDAELASSNTRLSAVSQERDDLEKQVNEHLGKAQAEAEQLRAEVQSKNAALDALKGELEGKQSEIAAALQTAEEAEDRLVAAYKRLEAEEAVRAKAKEATQIALALLSGDVDPSNGVSDHGARPDA